MPRSPRLKSQSGIYHIMLRGINRQTIFEDDGDRYRFLSTIRDQVEENSYIIHGYCLMGNHVHLLMEELDDDISLAVAKIGASYVYWYNKKYQRVGHLFQGRFKSEVVENDNYFKIVLRYIHNNPIKAGLCKNLQEYQWSSYREYIEKPTIIDADFCLELFSSDRQKSIKLFKDFMTQENEDDCLDFEDYLRLSDDEVRSIIKDMGINNISQLPKLEIKLRNQLLKRIKKTKGTSIRQISRITGISKSLIGRL